MIVGIFSLAMQKTNLICYCFRCIFSWIFLSPGPLFFSSYMPLASHGPRDKFHRDAIALITSSHVCATVTRSTMQAHPDYTFATLFRRGCCTRPLVEYPYRPCLIVAHPIHAVPNLSLTSPLFCFRTFLFCCTGSEMLCFLSLSTYPTPPHVLHVLTCEVLVSPDEYISLIFTLGCLGYTILYHRRDGILE